MCAVDDKPMIHVYFAGRLIEVDAETLGLSSEPSEGALRDALAEHLRVHRSRLGGHAVNRHTNGEITVRPALFG